MKYQVIVGNIGTVCDTDSLVEAKHTFREYVRQSEKGYGRSAGEPVTIMDSNEPYKEYIPDPPKLRIPISHVQELLVRLKRGIGDEYRATVEDTKPSMCVTIATTDGKSWNYQTGDNSYTGGAYGCQHWAVVYLYRNSNTREIAKDALNQLSDLMSS